MNLNLLRVSVYCFILNLKWIQNRFFWTFWGLVLKEVDTFDLCVGMFGFDADSNEHRTRSEYEFIFYLFVNKVVYF